MSSVIAKVKVDVASYNTQLKSASIELLSLVDTCNSFHEWDLLWLNEQTQDLERLNQNIRENLEKQQSFIQAGCYDQMYVCNIELKKLVTHRRLIHEALMRYKQKLDFQKKYLASLTCAVQDLTNISKSCE